MRVERLLDLERFLIRFRGLEGFGLLALRIVLEDPKP